MRMLLPRLGIELTRVFTNEQITFRHHCVLTWIFIDQLLKMQAYPLVILDPR